MSEDFAQPRSMVTPPPETTAGPSKPRLALAFLVAAASDAVSYGTEWVPPVQWAVDGTTALLLFGLLGRRWAILPGLVAEAVPGVAAFPVWVLVVASVALWGEVKRTAPTSRPRARGGPPGGGASMLVWAVVVLVLALVAAVFGSGGSPRPLPVARRASRSFLSSSSSSYWCWACGGVADPSERPKKGRYGRVMGSMRQKHAISDPKPARLGLHLTTVLLALHRSG
jgi:hypothetical protein